MNILDGLNDSQHLAATHIDGPMLILAGAGSGKTKTITTRLAYLISEVGIDPASTLTLTFTNKAANEMRIRALSLLNSNDIKSQPLLCTFHKFGLLFLKFHIDALGRKNNFIIIDTDDKKRIIKSFESDLPTSLLASEISNYKNSLLSVDDVCKNIADSGSKEYGKEAFYQKAAKIYARYEEYLVANNLVDFDDLLVLTYKILDADERLAKEISNRYKYIMVDEYQDTNDIQYKLLKKLCMTHQNLCVVGDDDQSIYGWRGARIENILNFKDQFKDVLVVKLEHNYRSSEAILKAANELIEHNRGRLGKKLISTKGKGDDVAVIESADEALEAGKIAVLVKELMAFGVKPKDIAILYRVNALSRSLEEGLSREKIAYKMVGGVKFYERTEIKDIISYLRLILNNSDDFSLRRIINRPKRGLGKVSFERLQNIAYENKISLFEAISSPSLEFSKKLQEALLSFVKDTIELSHIDDVSLLVDMLESKFGIKKYYATLPDGSERAANIDEFYAMLKDQAQNSPMFDLDGFLNELTLASEADSISDEAISIMSVHASKGLEFEHLFVIGLEEGFFPLLGDSSDIEEERRLAYVALTRAKSKLTLSFATSRFYKGQRARLSKSRFLSESGVCAGSLVIQKSDEYKKGDLVKHKIFGIGRVTAVSNRAKEQKLSINFGGSVREIMSSFVEKAV